MDNLGKAGLGTGRRTDDFTNLEGRFVVAAGMRLLQVFDADRHARPIARGLCLYSLEKAFEYASGIEAASEGMRF